MMTNGNSRIILIKETSMDTPSSPECIGSSSPNSPTDSSEDSVEVRVDVISNPRVKRQKSHLHHHHNSKRQMTNDRSAPLKKRLCARNTNIDNVKTTQCDDNKESIVLRLTSGLTTPPPTSSLLLSPFRPWNNTLLNCQSDNISNGQLTSTSVNSVTISDITSNPLRNFFSITNETVNSDSSGKFRQYFRPPSPVKFEAISETFIKTENSNDSDKCQKSDSESTINLKISDDDDRLRSVKSENEDDMDSLPVNLSTGKTKINAKSNPQLSKVTRASVVSKVTGASVLSKKRS